MTATHRSRAPFAGGFLVTLLGLALAGCAGQDAAAGAAGAAGPPAAEPAFGVPAATAVLTAFDNADSTASAAGDLASLRGQEVSPSLDVSVAAVHKAEHFQRKQPTFQHVDPVFALPASDAGCFLVSAKLKLTGEELPFHDLSHFVRTPPGAWKLSHNVQISREGLATVQAMAGAVAGPSTEALSDQVRQRLEQQLFTRTTGSEAPDNTVLASNVLLDKQFAGGWAIYTQQMTGAGMTVERTLDKTQWSDCAAGTAAGTMTFLTVYASDTISRAPGSTGDVALAPAVPDMIALGKAAGVKGPSVRVSRVQTFLLLVPADAPATLLGLSDAPISAAVGK